MTSPLFSTYLRFVANIVRIEFKSLPISKRIKGFYKIDHWTKIENALCDNTQEIIKGILIKHAGSSKPDHSNEL